MPKKRKNRKPSIAVLGLGHVGLPTALGLAELDWKVIGTDDDREKMAILGSRKSPFHEPGLARLLTKHLRGGNFRLASDIAASIRDSNVIFICVGTPQSESGAADLSQVEAVARTIAENLNGYKLIVSKSTVPAITGEWIRKTIARNISGEMRPPGSPKVEFEVASNPEFLREGQAVHDFLHPDRVVIGVESGRGRKILEQIYRPLRCPILATSIRTAELIKHAANAFLATKISFINMVADFSEAVGADIEEVSTALGLDPRIGKQFLRAGVGFGGYCFPKDLRAFIHLGEGLGIDCGILKEVERVNLRRTQLFLGKIKKALWVLKGKTIGIWGLAFKPNTDDLREAPSLRIIEALRAEGVSVRLYDPAAMPNAQKLLPKGPPAVNYCSSAYEAARGTDAVLILTEWVEFRRVNLARVRGLMKVPVMIDGRNVFDVESVRAAGIEYHSVGRASAEPAASKNRGGKRLRANEASS